MNTLSFYRNKELFKNVLKNGEISYKTDYFTWFKLENIEGE